MYLRISVAASDRLFAKAMRRIRPRFEKLLRDFENTQFVHPIHEAILVGITNDEGESFFQEISNDQGFFQVIAGCPSGEPDDKLACAVFKGLWKAVHACPFSQTDRRSTEDLFKKYESQFRDEKTLN
jgi:hypothetical protein